MRVFQVTLHARTPCGCAHPCVCASPWAVFSPAVALPNCRKYVCVRACMHLCVSMKRVKPSRGTVKVQRSCVCTRAFMCLHVHGIVQGHRLNADCMHTHLRVSVPQVTQHPLLVCMHVCCVRIKPSPYQTCTYVCYVCQACMRISFVERSCAHARTCQAQSTSSVHACTCACVCIKPGRGAIISQCMSNQVRVLRVSQQACENCLKNIPKLVHCTKFHSCAM